MSKAKPCPFCGNSKIYMLDYTVKVEGEQVTVFFCLCANCESDGSPAYDREEAVEKWNTRYPTDAN